MWKKHNSTIELIFWITIVLAGCIYLYKTNDNNTSSYDDDPYSHIRELHGIDTVYSKDSAYIIHFIIDSVYHYVDSSDDEEYDAEDSRY